MKMPITDLTQNLVFTSSGSIWAVWRLHAPSYGMAATKMKYLIKQMHEEFFQALRGEALLSGISVSVDPASVAEAMIEGVDLDQAPQWCREVEATLGRLEELELGARTYWLAVPLAMSGPREAFERHASAVMASLSSAVGLSRMSPHPQVIEKALRQAHRLQQKLPSTLRARPASPAEVVWWTLHHQQRGLSLDDLAPLDAEQAIGERESLMQSMTLDPWIDPGAQTDDKKVNKDQIYQRRYLKVAAHSTPSYQAMHVISSMPTGGFTFPGGEWMAALDQLSFAVDWAWRMKVVSGREAKRLNSKLERRLNDQYEQRTDTGITGSQAELDVHARDIHEFQQALGRAENEVKVSVTPIFVVAGENPEIVKERSRLLHEFYRAMEINLHSPLPAQQEDLWWAMQVGTPSTRLVTEYQHETTSFHLAGAIPLASNQLGATKGALLGFNITGGLPAAVLHDIAGSITGNRSGSFAACAELGAGKTLLLKKVTGDVVDRGGRFVAIDRSSTKEWEYFGRSITDCVTVDLVDPVYSLDPLRVFGLRVGATYVESLAAMLMNVAPQDALGITLNEVLNPAYLTEHQLSSLPDVVAHLRQECALQGAEELGRKMTAFANRPLGRVLFDGSLPPMPVDARGIVFCTYGTDLPEPEELHSEHLFRQLPVEKIFGRALYAVIANFAHRICFADDTDLALFMAAEARYLTSNPQGLAIVNTFLTEGRKALAAIGLDGQDPEHFGPERGLIPTRIHLRQTDRDKAAKGLEWMGLDPHDETLLETITGFSPMGADNKVLPGREGEALMQDMAGHLGLLQVSLPSLDERLEAVRTTPGERHSEVLEAR